MGSGGEQRLELVRQKATLVDQQEIVDQHAFLLDRGAVGRHRARRDAADVGVMAARRGEEQEPPVRAEHRQHHGDVGQMRAAVVRIVERVDVARPQARAVQAQDRAHALAHGAQMHRHVGRIGDQHAALVKHGAGKIQALLHVDRIGGVLQRHAHLLGDRHEQVVEDLQHDRIGPGADRGLPRERLGAAQQEMIARGELGLPAGLDHHGGGGLGDDRRPLDRIARAQIGALEHGRRKALGRLMRRATGHHHDLVDRLERRRVGPRLDRPLGLADLGHPADRLDRHLLDHQRPPLDHEAVARAVLGLERAAQLAEAAMGDLERRVGAAVADVDARLGADLARRDALLPELLAALGAELLDGLGQARHQRGIEPRLDRALTQRAHVREPHAIGRQHARQRMHQDPLEARANRRPGRRAGRPRRQSSTARSRRCRGRARSRSA